MAVKLFELSILSMAVNGKLLNIVNQFKVCPKVVI